MNRIAGPSKPRRWNGVPLSPGMALGTCYRVESRSPGFYRVRILNKEVERELRRLETGIQATRQELINLKQKFLAEVGQEPAYLLDAYLMMLEDQQFVGELRGRIRGRLESPERALRTVSRRWLEAYRSLSDSFFRERGLDFGELVERIINNLDEEGSAAEATFPDDLILVAPELGLSLLAIYPLEQVKGLALSNACQTSHVTIIARSYQIPLVGGIGSVEAEFQTGDLILVDGNRGIVERNPEEDSAARYRIQIRDQRKQEVLPAGDRNPCLTTDGRRIFLYANTEVGAEVSGALRLGAEGIGLFRSEYIFLQSHSRRVDEEAQFSVYRTLAESVQDQIGAIRTVDLSEKAFQPDGTVEDERAAALGVRGLRLSLRHPEQFRIQIRAILRARRYGNLRIVLPMVSSLDELLEARRLIDQVQAELVDEAAHSAESPALGIMLEVPATLLILEDLIPHVDFVAVGTNDLIQYTLAASRVDEKAAYLYNPLHPAILKSLLHAVTVCETASVPAMVCGEMAGHPLHSLILVGLGFRHLSMNPYRLQNIKEGIRQWSFSRLQEAALELTRLKTAPEIRSFVGATFGDPAKIDLQSAELLSYP